MSKIADNSNNNGEKILGGYIAKKDVVRSGIGWVTTQSFNGEPPVRPENHKLVTVKASSVVVETDEGVETLYGADAVKEMLRVKETESNAIWVFHVEYVQKSQYYAIRYCNNLFGDWWEFVFEAPFSQMWNDL